MTLPLHPILLDIIKPSLLFRIYNALEGGFSSGIWLDAGTCFSWCVAFGVFEVLLVVAVSPPNSQRMKLL